MTWKCKFVGPSRGDWKVGNRPCPRKFDGYLILDGAAALLIESDLSIYLAWLITSIYAVDNFNFEPPAPHIHNWKYFIGNPFRFPLIIKANEISANNKDWSCVMAGER